jgi:hypothetical protein
MPPSLEELEAENERLRCELAYVFGKLGFIRGSLAEHPEWAGRRCSQLRESIHRALHPKEGTDAA